MVDEWAHCPENTIWLNTTASLENPEMLLGKKCCIRLSDYKTGWYERRYDDESFPCRQATERIDEYLKFVDYMSSPGTGVIAHFTA